MNFSIKSTQIKIDFYFTAVLTFMLVLFPSMTSLSFFVLCILHECGHLFCMLIFRKEPSKIEFGYYGMKIVPSEKELSAVKDIIIYSSGVFVNFIIFIIFKLIDKIEIANMSLVLGIFNLLPIETLDGGKIFSIIFANSKIAYLLSSITSVLVMIFGIFIAIYTKKNFSVLIVGIYLIVCTKFH